MSDNIDRRSFIKKGSLFLSGAFLSPSLLYTQGCAVAPAVLRVATVAGGLASALTILEYLNIKPTFTKAGNYKEGCQCTNNFKNDETAMSQAGMKVFAGIRRSPYLTDVAVLVGSESTNLKSSTKVSIQFQDKDSVMVNENELSAIKAATDFIREQYKFTSRDLAKAIALTGKRIIDVPNENDGTISKVMFYDNALGGYTLFNPSPKGALKQYTKGVVTLNLPGYTDSVKPIIGLTA